MLFLLSKFRALVVLSKVSSVGSAISLFLNYILQVDWDILRESFGAVINELKNFFTHLQPTLQQINFVLGLFVFVFAIVNLHYFFFVFVEPVGDFLGNQQVSPVLQLLFVKSLAADLLNLLAVSIFFVLLLFILRRVLLNAFLSTFQGLFAESFFCHDVQIQVKKDVLAFVQTIVDDWIVAITANFVRLLAFAVYNTVLGSMLSNQTMLYVAEQTLLLLWFSRLIVAPIIHFFVFFYCQMISVFLFDLAKYARIHYFLIGRDTSQLCRMLNSAAVLLFVLVFIQVLIAKKLLAIYLLTSSQFISKGHSLSM